jgi:hypothetical protein
MYINKGPTFTKHKAYITHMSLVDYPLVESMSVMDIPQTITHTLCYFIPSTITCSIDKHW